MSHRLLLQVCLAHLLGSDYTAGVYGCGIVNSLEILSAFNVTQVGTEKGLAEFRDWAATPMGSDKQPGRDSSSEEEGEEEPASSVGRLAKRAARRRCVGALPCTYHVIPRTHHATSNRVHTKAQPLAPARSC